MEMSKNYKEIGKEILKNIGGKENVISAAHCATRLRLVLKMIRMSMLKKSNQWQKSKEALIHRGNFK